MTITSTTGRWKNMFIRNPSFELRTIDAIASIPSSAQSENAKSIVPEMLIETVEVRVYQ
jgi:hypothetical protein